MKYKTRKGVVLVNIANQFVLIPTRAASKYCPRASKLTLLHMIVWRKMEREEDARDLIPGFSAFFNGNQEIAWNKICEIMEELYNEGFLIIDHAK